VNRAGASPTGPGSTAEAGTAEDHLRLHAARALGAITRQGIDLTVELVHDARTSLRRLRAAVRTVPALVEDPLATGAALQEVALALGAVRDVDVLAALLPPAVDTILPITDAEQTRTVLERELSARREEALDALELAAGTPGWRQAEALLRDWARTPPPLPALDAAQVLDRAEQVTERRLAAAGTNPAALHGARKAAKRWRYAAELLAAEPAAAVHQPRAELLQEQLGRIQDLGIALHLLDELGTARAGGASPAAPPAAPQGLAVLRAALAGRQQDLVSELAGRTDPPRPEPPPARVATRGSAAPPGHDGCPAPGR
jgi:CHAD domain-containing protein